MLHFYEKVKEENSGGGGGGTLFFKVTGILLVYDWVPYHFWF